MFWFRNRPCASPIPYSSSTSISDPIMAALLSSWSGWWSGKGSEEEKEDGEKEEGGKEEGEKEKEKEEGRKEEGGNTTESWSTGIGSKKLLGRLWTRHMIWLLKGMPKICSSAWVWLCQ